MSIFAAVVIAVAGKGHLIGSGLVTWYFYFKHGFSPLYAVKTVSFKEDVELKAAMVFAPCVFAWGFFLFGQVNCAFLL